MQIALKGSKTLNRILFALILFSVPTALTLVGGRALISCAYLSYMGTASTQWPKTQARIISSNVVGGLGLRSKKCSVNVEYEFTIRSINFRGRTLQFGQPLLEESQAVKIAAKYPTGTTVDAFYCPENPKLSVLEPGFGNTGFVLVLTSALFGCIFFTVGTIGLRLSYKEWRKQHMNHVGRSKR